MNHRLRVYEMNEDPINVLEGDGESAIYEQWFTEAIYATEYAQKYYPGHPYKVQAENELDRL